MSINLRRIYGIILRNFYADKRSMMRLVDLFYYPAVDIILWGITTKWLNQQQNPYLVTSVATSLVLWQVVSRCILEICIGAVEELWNRSIINLFSTPLQISEWLIGFIISSICKNCFVLPYGAILVWFIYGVNIFNIGWMLAPYLLLLLGSGWIIGFLGASVIMRWGRRAQSTPWMIAWLFLPLCAVYYPIASLPKAVQMIAYCTPLAHMFEAIRHHIITGAIAYNHLGIATILTAGYLTLVIMLFYRSFTRALDKGLTSLE